MSEGAASRRSVLVVEDDPQFSAALERGLRKTCDAKAVKSLAQARKLLSTKLWDGFLLDVVLPDGTGVSLLPEIRSKHPFAPIIVMTGGEADWPSRDAMVHGAFFVAKPMPMGWFESFQQLLERPDTAASQTRAGLSCGLRVMGLSERETDVILELATGDSAEVAAERLGITPAAVRSHCRNIYRRVGVSSLTELIARASGLRR